MKTKALGGWMAVCASFLTLAAFPSAADQAAPAANPDKTYTGTVAYVNPDGRTLGVKGLILSKNFNLGDSCAYVLLDKPTGAMTDLRPGEEVTVSYQNAHGVLVADSVKQDPMTEVGTITALDPATHMMTVHSGWRDRTFRIPDDCMVMLRGNKSGSLADIQVGNYVTVTYELPNDKWVARQIAQTSATFTGELTAVDMNDKTVKAKTLFGSKDFHLASNCAIMVNGKPEGQLSDLKLGSRMDFTYDDVNGVNVVNRIGGASSTHEVESTSAQPVAP